MANRPPFPYSIALGLMSPEQRRRWRKYERRVMRLPAPRGYFALKRTLEHGEKFARSCLLWKPRACR